MLGWHEMCHLLFLDFNFKLENMLRNNVTNILNPYENQQYGHNPVIPIAPHHITNLFPWSHSVLLNQQVVSEQILHKGTKY